MGGAGCGASPALEGSGRWIAGTRCRRLVVKEGSYPGKEGGGRSRRRRENGAEGGVGEGGVGKDFPVIC